MWDKLSETEIYQTLEKIRVQYNNLINDFHKPKSILKAFEDRYINALKGRMNLSVFLLAEIEAVKELHEKEIEKERIHQQEKLEKLKKDGVSKTFADKVYEENKEKISKYPKLKIYGDANEDIERLVGAVRELLTNYWHIISYIYKNELHSPEKMELNDFHHKLITKYDYKGDVPISKSYTYALKQIPRDTKKVEYEYHYIIKDTAFLLNDILYVFDEIIKSKKIPRSEKKIEKAIIGKYNKFLKDYEGLTFEESFKKVRDYLKNVIIDFRIKDIKRKSSF